MYHKKVDIRSFNLKNTNRTMLSLEIYPSNIQDHIQ